MTQPRIGTQAQWQAERDQLLKEEKELTCRGDELARKRRELPWFPSRRTTPSRPWRARRPSPICSTAAPSWSYTTAAGAERERLFARADERYPQLAELARNTNRVIPMIVLTPRGSA